MTEIFEFLKPAETTHFQAANKWMYRRGVERIQRVFLLPKNEAFFVRVGQGVLVYDTRTRKQKLLEDCRFIFAGSQSLQVGKDIFSYF